MTDEQTQLDRIEVQVNTIAKRLFGNGDVGVCEEVRALKDWRKTQVWVNRSLILAAIAFIGKVIYEMWAH